MPRSLSKKSQTNLDGQHSQESKKVDSSKSLKKPRKTTSASSKALQVSPKAGGLTRQKAALRRLGVKQEELDHSPKISDILKDSMGGVDKAINALRFSNDTSAIEFFRVYDAIPVGDRNSLPIEAVSLKAGVSPASLLGSAIMSFKSLKGQESALIAISNHPDVIKKTIEFAKNEKGHADRQMLHQAVGFLPSPKGTSFSVNLLGGKAQYGKPSEIEDGEVVEATGEDFDSVFPSINDVETDWQQNRQKLLGDGE